MESQDTELAKKAYSLLEQGLLEFKNKKIAVSFSAGIDSTLIFQTLINIGAKPYGICLGKQNSEDVIYTKKLLKKNNYNIEIFYLEEYQKELLTSFNYFLDKGLNKVRANVLAPIQLVAQFCKQRKYTTITTGSGSEELFFGYLRYYLHVKKQDLFQISKKEFDFFTSKEGDMVWITKIFSRYGIKAIFPLAYPPFSNFILSTPVSWRMGPRDLKKKGIRLIAKIAGVDELILNRNKKAIQYSSKSQQIISNLNKAEK